MLSSLIAFCLRQRALTLILTAMLIGLGVYAFLHLPIDAFPDVSSTQVKIILKAPGMTPEEVESRIAVPVEQELLGIPHQKLLRSTSKYALADITLDFDEGTDIYWARQQVSERLGGVMAALPEGASGGLAPITTPLGEMFMFTVEGPQSLEARRQVLDWVIRPALRTVPGVADVNSLGGRVATFEVVPDLRALQARGLSLQDLQEALIKGHRNDGAGRLTQGEEALIVRAVGALRTLDDVRATVVRGNASQVVRVSDVATVRMGELTRYGAVTRNGQSEAVEGLVLGLRGANARDVVAGVKQALSRIAPTLPAGMRTEAFYDRSTLVDRAVHTVGKALAEAVVLVLILLLAFLGNLRAALVVALMLPLAALGTFVLMRQTGLTANLMSLGGLAIAIGMLVDGAVVVVENIEAAMGQPQAKRVPWLHLVFRASREVATPVASGIAIIVIVFLPLLSLEGLEGKLFAPVALTIVYALGVSLLLSLTVVPVLATWMLKGIDPHEPWLMRKLMRGYQVMQAWAVAQPKTLMGLALASLLVCGVLFAQLGKSFMPTLDEGDIIMQLEKLPSIGLDASTQMDLRVQQALMARVPEVKGVVARNGSDELGLDPMGLNQTDTFLVLKPREQWRRPDKDWLIEQLRLVMKDFPGIDVGFTQPIDMRVSEMLTGARGDVVIKVFGPDLDKLQSLTAQIQGLISPIAGATDTLVVRNGGVQYLQLELDRLGAGRFGLDMAQLSTDLRRLVEGETIGTIHEAGRRVPLVLHGDEALRRSPTEFEQSRLVTPQGVPVAVSEVARLHRVEGPVKIDREQGQRQSLVQTNVEGRDLVGFVAEARAKVDQAIHLPEGYSISWGGQFENQQRAAKRLSLVIPVAVALIFFVLFSTFGSVRQSFLVLANVPLALMGGVVGLALAGEYLSVPASVGFIALLGIAVLNGVVMVSHFNQLLSQGLPIRRVVVEGAQRRLRPVLMTAAITAVGLVPLLFATGPGSEIQKPLAIVVIGGLVSSTFLTLLLMPVMFERWGQDRPNPVEAAHV